MYFVAYTAYDTCTVVLYPVVDVAAVEKKIEAYI